MTYAIRFDFPELDVSLFAGLHKDAFGGAPTIATALMFKNADVAKNSLETGYGEETKRYGRVVTVRAGLADVGS